MSNTGQPFVNFESRSLLEREDLKDRFFDFLNSQLTSSLARIYNNPGVFDSLLVLSIPAADQFSIVGTSLATDGLGNIIDINGSFANCQAVSFENASAIDYEVTLHVVEGPELHASQNTILVNNRTGAPEYRGLMNYIGEKGDPDSVDILGSTITLAIDSLCEAGVTHAGRQAVAYLKTPAAMTSDVGLPVLPVQYIAGENVVVIETTLLGQSVASTDPADYEVVVLGPTVRRNSGNSNTEGYVLIGEVTGSGSPSSPSVFSTIGQDLITVSLSEINNSFANFVTDEELSASGAGVKTVWDSATQYGYTASAIVGTEMFVFGGVTGYAGSATFSNQVQIYDIDGDSWSASAVSLPASLCGCAALARGTIIYVVGGHNASGAVTSVRRYDTVGDAWLSDGASLPAARAYGSLVMSRDGQYLYYVGGSSHAHNAAAAVQREVYVYDINGDSWSTQATIPTLTPDSAGGPNCVLVDDVIYILGGSTHINASTDGEASDNCISYNIQSDSWTPVSPAAGSLANAPLSQAVNGSTQRYQMDTCAVYGKPACFHYNGLVHLIGGDRPTFAMGTPGVNDPNYPSFGGKHSAYSILNNEWTIMPKVKSAARYATTWAVTDGVLYTFKGLPKETSGQEINGREDDAFALDLSLIYSSDSPGAAFTTVEEKEILTVASSLHQGNMWSTRTRFASVKFAGGILISGGINDLGDPLDTAEIYWPQTNTVQVLPSFPAATNRYDHKMVVLEQNGEELVYVLPGKTTAGANTVNNDIFLLKASNTTDGFWTSTYLANAPDRSAYAVGLKGKLAFIIGGVNGTGISPSFVSTYDLETDSHILSAIQVTETWSTPTSSAQLGDEAVYIATTAGSDRFLKFDLQQNVGDGVNDHMDDVAGGNAYFTATIEQPGMTVWDGNVYIFDPDSGGSIAIYNPLHQRTPSGTNESIHAMEAFTSFSSNFYGAEMQAIDGMLVRMGGSTTNTYSDAASTIRVYSIAGGEVRSKEAIQITNFKTKQSGESVGFKAGQPFGQICYTDQQLPSFILMGNDVG